MTGPKRMKEDILLDTLLASATSWMLRIEGANRTLQVVRPPGDSVDCHLQWILVKPVGRGWYPGPDILLVDDRRELMLVVEAKREDTDGHRAARDEAFVEAVGYAHLFDELRHIEPANIWVGMQENPHRLLEVLDMTAAELKSATVVPTMLGLGPAKGSGLQIASFLTARLRDEVPIAIPNDAPRWQGNVPPETWNAALRRYCTWACAERVEPSSTEVAFQCLEVPVE